MSIQQLNTLEAASVAINRAVDAARARPEFANLTSQAIAALYNLEQQNQTDLSTRSRAPMPAADPTKVGAWASGLKHNGPFLARIMQLAPNPKLVAANDGLKAGADKLFDRIMTPAPVSQGFGNPATLAAVAVSAPTAAGAALGVKKLVGIGLQVLAILGTGGAAWGMWKYEKKQMADGLDVDPDAEPDAIRARTQRTLDSELPGSTVTLSSTADGVWISSVKRGSEIIARGRGKKPHDAAGEATVRALEYEDMKKRPAKAVFVEKSTRHAAAKPPPPVVIEDVSSDAADAAVDVSPAKAG